MKNPTRPDPANASDVTRLGDELRAARLALGLTVEDVAASLRIRTAYLEALEAGRLHDLPAPAYALGFLRLYAGALGLEAEEMARRFREAGGAAARRGTELVFPEPVPERRLPSGAVMLPAAVLAVGACLGWYAWSGSDNRAVDAGPALPPTLEQAARQGRPAEAPAAPAPSGIAAAPAPFLPPPSPRATPESATAAAASSSGLPAAPDATAPAIAVAVPSEPGRVALRVRADAWVEVRAGKAGPVLINRVLRPGEVWTAPAREGLLLSTRNAGALEILVDGEPVPGLGGTPPVRRGVPLEPERLKAGPVPAPR